MMNIINKTHLRLIKQIGELAQRNDDVVEDITHHVVGGDLSALAEAVYGLLNDGELETLVVDERERRDGLTPHDVENLLIVGAGGRVYVVGVVRGAATHDQLPQVIVAHGARVLARHYDLLAAYRRVDFLEQALVEVAAAVHLAQVLLELVAHHRRALLLHVVVVLVHVEHDYGVGERERRVVVDQTRAVVGRWRRRRCPRRVRRRRRGLATIRLTVVLGEVFEHVRDERRLARQPKRLEEDPQRLVDSQ